MSQPLKLHMQYFAEPPVDTTIDPATTTGEPAAKEETTEAPKGRFAEFMKALFEGSTGKDEGNLDGKDEKAEGGKKGAAQETPVVDFEKRLAEEKAKWEAELLKKEELSKLPDADKVKAEADAQRAELAAVKQQLAERELKA